MDAKSRADFINSVAEGQKIPCLSCNKLNNASSKFCVFCGKPLTVPQNPEKLSGEASYTKPLAKTQNPEKLLGKVPEEEPCEEPKSAFAEGLPNWNLVPPQVVVRRRGK